MLGYIARRLLLMVPTLIGVTAVVFFVMALAPGGFGGVMLNQEGSQNVGDEAKRIQQQFMRRYGLDQPYVVQYGRWLNQISPVGFTMSAQYVWPGQAKADVRDALQDVAFITREREMDQAVDLVLQMAAYDGSTATDMAQRFRAALADPVGAMSLFDVIDSQPWDPDDLRASIRQRAEGGDLAAAQQVLYDALRGQALGRSRVMFSSPTVHVPDLGQSLRGVSVLTLLRQRVPITLLLSLITIPIIYLVSIPCGVLAARRRGGVFDVTTGGAFLALWSIPVIWAGVMAIGYLANDRYINGFPTNGLHALRADQMAFFPRWTSAAGFERGWLLDFAWHLVLPVACMTYGGFAVLVKITRGAILDNLGSDYVRTARAKGVADRRVLWRHVFRNSILPLITIAAAILPGLFAGSVVVETIFSINGMGKLAVEAAFQKDRELVMGTTLIAAMLGLSSELLRDLIYAAADPRVSYD